MNSEEVLLARVRAHFEAHMDGAALTDEIRNAAADGLLTGALMNATAALIPMALAAEQAAEAAKDVRESTRRLLLEVLEQTTGVIRYGAMQASVGRGTPSVVITDEAAIPPAMMRTAPDKAAILAQLKAGKHIPGATLSNAAPRLSITTHGAKA